MSKRMARLVAASVLACGIVGVPAAGSAFAAGHGGSRGSELFYSHEVQANTSHVSYSESTVLHAGQGDEQYGRHGLGHHGLGFARGGLLGLGLIIL